MRIEITCNIEDVDFTLTEWALFKTDVVNLVVDIYAKYQVDVDVDANNRKIEFVIDTPSEMYQEYPTHVITEINNLIDKHLNKTQHATGDDL